MFGIDDVLLGVGLNFIGNMITNDKQDSRQDSQQGFNQQMQEDSQVFNAEQAAMQRDWAAQQADTNRSFEERMSNTSMQRRIQDLRHAGLNPLLALGAGGASTPNGGIPGGASASAGMASSSIASPTPFNDVAAGMSNASQLEVNRAQRENIVAETERKKAETKEIEARTPTHEVTREQMTQSIEESKTRVINLLQQTETSAATAQNLAQQTTNLAELIPQIRATVENIKAHTKLQGAQTTLAGAQTGLARESTQLARTHGTLATAETFRTVKQTNEIEQRVRAGLPQLQEALQNLEIIYKRMEAPRHQLDEITHDSFTGALSATIRALTGLGQITRH